MPSSTSNSEHGFAERDVPDKPWLGMLAVVVILVAAGFWRWELEVRARGYTASPDDTPILWASQRALARGA